MSTIIFDGKEMSRQEKRELAKRALTRLEKQQPPPASPPRPLNVTDARSFDFIVTPKPVIRNFKRSSLFLGLAMMLAAALLFAAVVVSENPHLVGK